MLMGNAIPMILASQVTLKVRAKGVYRDPVRSTHEKFVKSSGLRWVCVVLLVDISWAGRI